MYQELYGLPPANTPAIEVVRRPGVTWVYSPAGYTILQAMLMNIYGTPFADIMAKLALQPFGMTHSTFLQPTPPSLTPSIAVPYNPVPVGAPQPPSSATRMSHGQGRYAQWSAGFRYGGIRRTDDDANRPRQDDHRLSESACRPAARILTPQIAQAMNVASPARYRDRHHVLRIVMTTGVWVSMSV
jgi:CubicO group peptidase (beta-lactamase class C family)